MAARMRRLVEAFAYADLTPRVAAMALALARPHDQTTTLVACAWIAAKFEEVDPPEAWELLDVFQHRAPKTALVRAEAAVLARCDWRLPHRTPASRLVHLLNDAARHRDVHLLLWAGVLGLYTPREWRRILRREPRHPALQLAAMWQTNKP